MARSNRQRALLVCAVAWAAACADTSTPEFARQRSALCDTTNDCAPGLFCVLNLCCADPCGNALCGVVSAGACDDGNPCTQNDSCGSGACMGTPSSGTSCGAGMVCEQGACRVGCWVGNARVDAGVRDGCMTCDPARSTSGWSVAVDAGCDDGNACTLADRCDGTGACVGTGLVVCGHEVCHESSWCDPQTGQCSAPEPLSDGVSCDGDHYCLGGSCTHACNIDGGVVLAGAFKPGNPCKQCNPEVDSTAWTTLDDVPCDDGNACSLSSVCSSGSCLAIDVVTCVAIDACHLAGVCDPSTGACSNPLADAGTPCTDGRSCTVNDVCAAGACVGDGAGCGCLTPADCPPAEPCHVLAGCVSNQCSYVADDSVPCSDGDACTTGDHCSSGTCVASAEVRCDAHEVCVASACDATSGACVKHTLENGAPCDGGRCVGGVCAGHDAGVDALAPVVLSTSGCGTGGAFSLVALAGLWWARRRF